MKRTRAQWLSAIVVTLTLVAAAVVLLIAPSNAETPAERCARETATYNAAWEQTWRATNPGNPGPPPPPPAPYVCRDPGQPTESTTTAAPPSTFDLDVPNNENPESGIHVDSNAPTKMPQNDGGFIVPTPARPTSPKVAPSSPPAAEIELPTRPARTETSVPPDIAKCNEADGNLALGLGCDLTGLGPNELEVCTTNMIDCTRAQKADSSGKASREADKYFPGPTLAENRKDAARHCIWSAIMTESANSGFAEDLAEAHEQDNPLNVGDQNISAKEIESQQAASHKMDEFNNATGREVGLRNEGSETGIINECVTLARDAAPIDRTSLMALGDSDGSRLVIQRDQP